VNVSECELHYSGSVQGLVAGSAELGDAICVLRKTGVSWPLERHLSCQEEISCCVLYSKTERAGLLKMIGILVQDIPEEHNVTSPQSACALRL
jgi:hypothetical protein